MIFVLIYKELVSSYVMKWLLDFFLNESKLRVKCIMKKKTQLDSVFNYMKLCSIYLYFVLCNSRR